MYVVFEGIDGSGKTTQLTLLCDRLRRLFYTPIRLAEPTYGIYGKNIREHMRKGDGISMERQRELFTLDRREHVKKKLKPALEFIRANESFVIVQDRYYLSASAYQADGEVDMLTLLKEQQSIAPKPDYVFLIDVSPKEAMQRLLKGSPDDLTLFENEEKLEGWL